MTVTLKRQAPVPAEPLAPEERRSRFWRSVWRLHFYSGVVVMPLLVVLAISGLVIMYGDVIQQHTGSQLRKVTPAGQSIGLDDQVTTAAVLYKGGAVQSVTPPAFPDRSTEVIVNDKAGKAHDVFVDPHTARVLGVGKGQSDIVGFANRVHKYLLLGGKISLPTLNGVVGSDKTWRKVYVGDIIVEVLIGWGILLVLSGLYLWWPRKSGTGRGPLKIRVGKKGRARWRDLHAVPNAIFASFLLIFMISGMPWSGFWGSNWHHIADKVTPGTLPVDGLPSPLPKAGDVDRLGKPISWPAMTLQTPASADSKPAPTIPRLAPRKSTTSPCPRECASATPSGCPPTPRPKTAPWPTVPTTSTAPTPAGSATSGTCTLISSPARPCLTSTESGRGMVPSVR